ncbi:heat-inducible transcriptional repressor HrcA [Kallotenue papyrolyticum]|uniref:heat-inducible transcriptional repressor HrcA n=1 Tax=Kallotenue papyrolyticum TaxID=1325125 RepID=UPI0004BB4863|nr:heat-inducible transcriptional repressor HrcA [Kallotenue papyrolyticum]
MRYELTERRQLILKLVIQEYIESPARPVASETLQRKYNLQYSSATIRNELAALEELGLLTHLHTSAGRIPTDAGYRYFVENLMERQALSPQEQRTIQHQFYQVRGELEQWIHLAAAVLARIAHNAAVVMPPRSLEVRFKHLELIAIYETVILLVLVLHDGTIKQQTLTSEQPYSQDELSQVAQRFNQQLHNAGLAEVERLERTDWEPPLSAFEQTVLELIARAMRQLEGQINERLYHDGLLEMLQQPEFSQPERIRQAIAILEEGKGINPLIPQALSSNGVQVVIGGEHVEDAMREYSVVLARYGRGRDLAGVVGIFGPTRMPYPRSISSVRYISSVMSDLLAELYGQRPDA